MHLCDGERRGYVIGYQQSDINFFGLVSDFLPIFNTIFTMIFRGLPNETICTKNTIK